MAPKPKLGDWREETLDRIPQFDYDRLLWGERQIRSVANMTRPDARDFLAIAAEISRAVRMGLSVAAGR